MSFTLQLNKPELAMLLLHMSIMRLTIKKGLKSNYGLLEGRKKVKIYDSIKKVISAHYEDIEELEIEHCNIDLNAEQVDMLSSFMNWYVQELKLSAEDEGYKHEGNETLKILETIKEKITDIDELLTEKIIQNACL